MWSKINVDSKSDFNHIKFLSLIGPFPKYFSLDWVGLNLSSGGNGLDGDKKRDDLGRLQFSLGMTWLLI